MYTITESALRLLLYLTPKRLITNNVVLILWGIHYLNANNCALIIIKIIVVMKVSVTVYVTTVLKVNANGRITNK